MKIKNVSGILLGACVVYVSMAACTATDHIQLSSGASGGGSGNSGMGGAGEVSSSDSGMGGMIGMGGAGGVGGMIEDAGGIFDALTDPVPDASADPTSGTRLKAKYIKADDGARAPMADVWHDSQRNEECRFQRASDGKQRCLPTSVNYAGYYADASCTQLLAYIQTGCTPTKYAGEALQLCSGVSFTYNYYPLGAKVNPATVYVKSGAMCVGTSPLVGYDYYSTGGMISPSAFVAGVVEIDP